VAGLSCSSIRKGRLLSGPGLTPCAPAKVSYPRHRSAVKPLASVLLDIGLEHNKKTAGHKEGKNDKGDNQETHGLLS
jgi:hypothetical protein